MKVGIYPKDWPPDGSGPRPDRNTKGKNAVGKIRGGLIRSLAPIVSEQLSPGDDGAKEQGGTDEDHASRFGGRSEFLQAERSQTLLLLRGNYLGLRCTHLAARYCGATEAIEYRADQGLDDARPTTIDRAGRCPVFGCRRAQSTCAKHYECEYEQHENSQELLSNRSMMMVHVSLHVFTVLVFVCLDVFREASRQSTGR